jgi:hypothetical protein
MVNPEWARPAQNFDNSTRMSFEGVGELEDLHRIETVAATLGLFIADLIANVRRLFAPVDSIKRDVAVFALHRRQFSLMPCLAARQG